jgi:hypothetical protein
MVVIVIDHDSFLSSWTIAYVLLQSYRQITIVIIEKTNNFNYPWCGLSTLNYQNHQLFEINLIIPVSSVIIKKNFIDFKFNRLNRLGLIYHPTFILKFLHVSLKLSTKVKFINNYNEIPIFSNKIIILRFNYPKINDENFISSNLSPTNLKFQLLWLPKFYIKPDYKLDYGHKFNHTEIVISTTNVYESINCRLNLIHNLKLSNLVKTSIKSLFSKI